MKRILVTGVGGNVGQYIANELTNAGYEVVGIYRKHMPERADYQLIEADISEWRGGGIENIDVVIHIAAGLTGTARSLINDNIEATKRLIRFAEQSHIKRIVYMSTVSVYGNTGEELSEGSNIINPSVYGMTKRLCESLIKESEIPEKLIIQLPKMIGPYVHMDNTEGSGFLTMTKKILRGENVVCYIPELQYNNYLHVSELEKFLEHLLTSEKWEENGKILVGAKERLTMLEILHIMRDEIGSKSEIIPECNGTLPECFLIDISRAEALGFAPCSAEDMLKRFIREINVKV